MRMKYERFDIRHLEDILLLWNKELSDTFPMRLQLLRQNIVEDRHWLREGSWVAKRGETGQIVGFVIAKIALDGAEQFGIPQT